MTGIIITPGTFNPVATPFQTGGVYRFPKTPVVTLRRPWMQWATRPTEPADAGPPSYPINYVSMEWTTGEMVVAIISDSFNGSGPAEVKLSGARYLPNGTYTKSGFNAAAKRYNLDSDPILVADTGGIDIGTVVVKTSSTYGSKVVVLIPYSLTMDGTGDSAVYTLTAAADETLTTASGTLRTSFDAGPVDQFAFIFLNLFRDGALFDRVRIAIRVHGTVTSSDTGPDEQPTVSAGFTIAETLYGAQSGVTGITPPSGVPLGGYYRQSIQYQGRATPL